jgi:hypothetical protein
MLTGAFSYLSTSISSGFQVGSGMVTGSPIGFLSAGNGRPKHNATASFKTRSQNITNRTSRNNAIRNTHAGVTDGTNFEGILDDATLDGGKNERHEEPSRLGLK